MPKMRTLDVTEERWDPTNEDEFTFWPRVLWIDPGVVSGIAVLWFDPAALFNSEPLGRCLLAVSDAYLHGPLVGRNSHASRYLALRRELNVDAGLISGVESFTPRKIDYNPDFLAPVRVRSAIEHQLDLDDPDATLYDQSPGDALGAFSNDRLHALNLYSEGPDHKNDAKRHALLWIQRMRAGGRELFTQHHGSEPRWWD